MIDTEPTQEHGLLIRVAIERHDAIQRGLLWLMSSNAIVWVMAAVSFVASFLGQNWFSVLGSVVLPFLRPSDGRGLPATTNLTELFVWFFVPTTLLVGFGYLVTPSPSMFETLLQHVRVVIVILGQSYILADMFSPPRDRKKIKMPAFGRAKVEWAGEITS